VNQFIITCSTFLADQPISDIMRCLIAKKKDQTMAETFHIEFFQRLQDFVSLVFLTKKLEHLYLQ
jgi:hypothetical protein